MYMKDKSAEEIYSEYYDNDDLKKNYDIEEMGEVSNIPITKPINKRK